MTDINNIESLGNDLFAFRISYDNIVHPESGGMPVQFYSPLYNGNIAETYWRTSTDEVLRKYGYAYDKLNRLQGSVYIKPVSGTDPAMPVGNYNESLTYDKNGNIMSLIRYGDTDSSPVIAIDDLEYTYDSGNRLLKVKDNTGNPSGFKEGVYTGDAFDYDDYGNLIEDKNKGITAITYNHLNLPKKIEFGSTDGITYLYNANGQKIQKTVVNSPNVSTVNYQGAFHYENGILRFLTTAEGYVNVTTKGYNYVYNYTDHLGNIRLSYMNDRLLGLLILDETHYYPFGLKQKGYEPPPAYATSYKYKYNGKEFQDELGLNLYDYHARLYDPAIGRMLQIDPNAYKYGKLSPYNYAFNNPVLVTDPDGKDGIVTGMGTKKDPYKIKANYYYYGLDNDQKEGFLSAISSFNNKGKAHTIEDADGNKMYAIFELNAVEAANEDAANALADNDIMTIVDGDNIANLRFGNTVSNGAAGDANHLGNANSNHINLDGSATRSFFDSPNPNTKISSIYKGTSIHEIGHNLGGNHNDPGNIMSFSNKNYNTGSGINQTQGTVFSSPSVNSNGIQAILGRMVTVGQVLSNSGAGYNTTGSRYFGPKQNAKITEGSVGRLVYKPD